MVIRYGFFGVHVIRLLTRYEVLVGGVQRKLFDVEKINGCMSSRSGHQLH